MWLSGINLAVALLLLALVLLVLERSHREYEAEAKTVAEGLAAVAQLNVQSEIDRVDGVIRATAAELERLLLVPKDDTLLNELLSARYELLSGIEAFRLADGDGLVRWGTGLPPGAATNVADRDYFLEAKQQARPATFIAGPLKSRVSGNWVVAFVHPLRVRGEFAGILYVSVNVEHFRQLFEQYDLEPRDAVTLRRHDMRLVARFSPGSRTQGEPGDAAVSPELRTAFASSPRAGTFVSRAVVDGEVRTTAYRALKSWPYVVLAGVNNERFFKPWRQEAWRVGSLATVAFLLVSAATWLVLRANFRVEGAMQALADQGKRIQALLRTAGDGIHIMDGTGHLVEMSDSFADMLKSTREKLLGRHIASWDVNQDRPAIDAWLTRIKAGDRQRVDVQHRRDDGQVIDVEMQLSIAEISGKLFVFSSSRDVTSQRRLLREQAAMLNSDLVGMAKIENRIITWRNRAVERILGYGHGELEGRPVRDVYWDDAGYQQMGVEGYSALKTDGFYRTQLRMRRKCGEGIWIDFGAVPLSETEVFVMLVDVTATRQSLDNLMHAASHDALTGLPNRVLLHDRVGRALAVAKRQEKQTAVCYLDLDGFKSVNDQYGHDAGDQLLKATAQRLQAAIRPSDTAARLGGDEFVLVLACVEGEEWKQVLDRVVETVGEPVVLDSGIAVAVGVTVGVVISSPDDGVGIQELIDRADHVMLRGKRSGKGRVFV